MYRVASFMTSILVSGSMTLLMHNSDPDDRHKSYEKTVKCEMKPDLGNKRQPDLI